MHSFEFFVILLGFFSSFPLPSGERVRVRGKHGNKNNDFCIISLSYCPAERDPPQAETIKTILGQPT
jgi:hypothetical protein